MSARCCRSIPRCADCPVRAKAVGRRTPGPTPTAELIAEILAGRPPRPLPPAVAAMVAQLEAERSGRQPSAALSRWGAPTGLDWLEPR